MRQQFNSCSICNPLDISTSNYAKHRRGEGGTELNVVKSMLSRHTYL